MAGGKLLFCVGKRAGILLILTALLVIPPVPARAQMLLNGAGATFPYPIYSKWFSVYAQVNPSVRFNYQAVGSGAGIRQISEQTVDFGASDAPMTEQQMKDARGGRIFHFPMVLGAVVLTYNLPGIGSGLRFSGPILADIFLGKITSWNDPRLSYLNPGVKLPQEDIIVVHRSDGSGTTNIFTSYLGSVNPGWASRVGHGTSVNWPVGLGGKGNQGVTGQVKNTSGSLGYVELAYAVTNHLPHAVLRNRAGSFVEATLDSTSAAAAGAARSMPSDFRITIVNQPGKETYPIAGFTWLLVYKNQTNKAKGEALVNYLWWAIHQGQEYTKDLLYAPLPPPVVKLEEEQIRAISYQGKPLLTHR